jgi:hypothetical protein
VREWQGDLPRANEDRKGIKEKPPPLPVRVDQDKAPGGDLLSHGRTTLPSAHARFTSEFGMGSGGTTPLWPPGKGWEQRMCASLHNFLKTPIFDGTDQHSP